MRASVRAQEPLPSSSAWLRSRLGDDSWLASFTQTDLPREDRIDVASNLHTELTRLLDSKPVEQTLQDWLTEHPIAFGSEVGVLAAPPLAHEYQLDFALVQNITVGFTWTFVELKRPGTSLFRRDGLPTAELSAAVAQLDRYHLWVANNVAFARQWYSDILQPRGRVVMGRRDGLSANEREYLRHHNTSRRIEIRTYDSLLDAVRFISPFELTVQNGLTDALERHLPKLVRRFCRTR